MKFNFFMYFIYLNKFFLVCCLKKINGELFISIYNLAYILIIDEMIFSKIGRKYEGILIIGKLVIMGLIVFS